MARQASAYAALDVRELRGRCLELGLAQDGGKNELVGRLEDFVAAGHRRQNRRSGKSRRGTSELAAAAGGPADAPPPPAPPAPPAPAPPHAPKQPARGRRSSLQWPPRRLCGRGGRVRDDALADISNVLSEAAAPSGAKLRGTRDANADDTEIAFALRAKPPLGAAPREAGGARSASPCLGAAPASNPFDVLSFRELLDKEFPDEEAGAAGAGFVVWTAQVTTAAAAAGGPPVDAPEASRTEVETNFPTLAAANKFAVALFCKLWQEEPFADPLSSVQMPAATNCVTLCAKVSETSFKLVGVSRAAPTPGRCTSCPETALGAAAIRDGFAPAPPRVRPRRATMLTPSPRPTRFRRMASTSTLSSLAMTKATP